MKKLIFDITVTGHHSEYLGHLIDYLNNHKIDDNEYFFVVHTKFATLFPDIYTKGERIDSVKWVAVDEAELSYVESGGGFLGSLRSMDIMSLYAKKLGTDYVLALDFHTIKYGAIFKNIPYNLSSILFLQFYRLKRRTIKQKIEFYKRYLVTKLCLKNPKVNRVFVLNDQETVDYMNNEFHTSCFQMLPDPIPRLKPLDGFDIYEHYNIDSDRKIYLHIGALGDRKGTLEVIESASLIEPSIRDKVTILLVGKTGSVHQEIYNKKIEKKGRHTGVQLIWDNQFVSSQMMKSLFDQCDFVLLPYKNAEFSSGILGHAAAAKKPVIATGEGLVKELVSKYDLGILLESPTAEEISKKISNTIIQEQKFLIDQEFVEQHNPESFAKKLLY